jgi:hypothetical protein
MGPPGPGAFIGVGTVGFTGSTFGGAVSAFVTIPSSMFTIESRHSVAVTQAHGTIGVTGPLGAMNYVGMRILIGSAPGMEYRYGIGQTGWVSFGLIDSRAVASGVHTGCLQWRRLSGARNNIIGVANVVSTTFPIS